MEFKNINPFELHKNPWNSNRVDRENFEKLKKSLQSLGSFKPVVVRKIEEGYQILGGFHRVEAAKELGFKQIPIVNLGNIDDERAKEISLVDNTRYGEDDVEALNALLDSFDTELLSEILPDAPTVELPDTEDALKKLEEDLKATKEEDDDFKTLKFRLEVDKAEEIEAILSKTAFDHDYRYPDGYSNFSEALYHVLVLDRK